jgi:hypothetical protein
MNTITIKNFRFFRIKSISDLYEMVSSTNMLLSFYNQDDSSEHLYFNNTGFLSQKGIFDLEAEDLTSIAKQLKCDANLILGLLNAANDEDDDPLYDWLAEKGGKTKWFNLIENPEFKETNRLARFNNSIAVLCSEGEITAEQLEKDGINVDNQLISFEELLGHYDETKEFLLIYNK